MRYNLINVATGTLHDRFPNQEAALVLVRALVEANGVEIADTLMLGGRGDAGRVLPVQSREALLRRAQASTPDRPPLSQRAS